MIKPSKAANLSILILLSRNYQPIKSLHIPQFSRAVAIPNNSISLSSSNFSTPAFDFYILRESNASGFTDGLGAQCRKIPDVVTLSYLGFSFSHDVQNFTSIDQLDPYSPCGASVPQRILPERHDDDKYDNERMRMFALQTYPQLILEMRWIGFHYNPTVIPWRHQNRTHYLLITRIMPEEKFLGFQWLDTRLSPMKKIHLCVGNFEQQLFTGWDPRAVLREHPHRLSVIASLIPIQGQRMTPRLKLVELFLNSSSHCIEVLSDRPLIPLSGVYFCSEQHKNWSPFLYQGELLLIYGINPLTVVKVVPLDDKQDHAQEIHRDKNLTQLVSQGNTQQLSWQHGDLRGGTGAKRIGGIYLSFFHTRFPCPEDHSRINYYFGAYTFSGEPPFELLSVSSSPIIHPSFYIGPYSGIYKPAGRIPYIYFPTDFFFDNDLLELPATCDKDTMCLKRHNVTMIMGAQDQKSYAVVMNAFELLDSLSPIL